ncbi:phage tail protein [Azospirillum sp. sgz301742]
MSEAYTGEIRMFAGNYAPENWLLCNGSLQPINTYQLLYSLIGTTFGGDGVTTFGLPDLRGRLPVGQGQGTSLTNRVLGQTGGASMVQLVEANLPAHTHVANACTTVGSTPVIAEGIGLAQTDTPANGKVVRYAPPSSNPTLANLAPSTVESDGSGNQPHTNVMPYLAINYIICPTGMYPQRP